MGDQVTPGSICLTFAAQFLSLGESYLACDLGVGCAGERVSNVQFSMSGVKVIVMSCNTDSHTGNKGRKTHFPFTFAKEVKRNRKKSGSITWGAQNCDHMYTLLFMKLMANDRIIALIHRA